MSIHNISDKIKGLDHYTQLTIIHICVLVFVGLGAFGLGRLSAGSNTTVEPVRILDANVGSSSVGLGNITNNLSTINTRASNTSVSVGAYIASKNGKLYYTVDCSGAKRIKKENQVWFMTESDAQKSGFTRSTACK